ncbi:hypothetical protein G9A89_001432 [Geosiphon pyriformis]|nr:hypothetical protein G9A89_001432 [Geosiphon pyriformis]
MQSLSLLSIAYVLVEFLSLGLVIFSSLLLLKRRTKPFLAKWTLFQYFISAFLERIFAIPAILLYSHDNDSSFQKLETFCVIQAYLGRLIFYPSQITTTAIAVYLWYGVARNQNFEKRVFSLITCFIWAIALVGTMVHLGIGWGTHRWGVEIEWYGFASIYAHFSIWLRQIERTVLGYWYGIWLTGTSLCVSLVQISNSIPVIFDLVTGRERFSLAPNVLLFMRAIIIPMLYTIYIMLQSGIFKFPCIKLEKDEEDDDNNPEDVLSWPSSHTLTENRFSTHGDSGKIERGKFESPESILYQS